MEEISCPRCKTTKYRNPSLKLLVNVCGHSLCESCVDILFVRGSGACDQCGIPLRRTNFRLQLFEDSYVEKEVDIRKRILKDYNKKEEDFSTLREYNDYLEELETIVFNLTNGIDVEDTKRKIEQYKRENQDVIKKNLSKKSRAEEELEELVELERVEREENRRLALQSEEEEARSKRRNKEALIDKLMTSEMPADHILASHQQQLRTEKDEPRAQHRTTVFSTGIRMGGHKAAHVSGAPVEDVLFTYTPSSIDYLGPAPPDEVVMDTQGYLNNIRAASGGDRAGGYLPHLGCHRALQDAFCGLFFYSPDDGNTADTSSTRLPLMSH